MKTDIKWMKFALEMAVLAEKEGEIPVGAVLVNDNEIIATGSNCPITTHDPTAHAEIVVLRKAALHLQNYRLSGTTLYVTLEPCIMCMGAIIHARIDRLVFGAFDPKSGAAVSKYHIGTDGLLNHSLSATGGILEEKCSSLLKNFFAGRRKKKRESTDLAEKDPI